MKILRFSFILIFLLPACNGNRPDKGESNDSGLPAPDSTFFKSLVTHYIESINQADTSMGSRLWSQNDEISFITPSGHQHDWEGIKNIYLMFRDNFTERNLSFYNLKTSVYSDFAWLEFYWVFDALMKPDNSKVQTKGRETQIWRRKGNDWRLVHIHYSGMPATDISAQ